MASSVIWAVGALAVGFVNFFTISPTAGGSVLSGLGPLLSQEAQVYLPGSEGFQNATTRWSAATTPQFIAIVKVMTEADVQSTIIYANNNSYPFLAISGTHGTLQSLSTVKNGIGIWMRGMKDVHVNPADDRATIQGGIENGELIRELWTRRKQTVTTGCDCAGFIGPLLGGGHGWLQGRYGLPADQLVSARMVLANGTAITVSEADHADLFWAVRGAGHNFGIFTELDIRVYDREDNQDSWAALGLAYTHDKLENVFEIANTWLAAKDLDVELTHFGVFTWDPNLDAGKPVLTFWIYWQGTDIPSKYTAPLKALSPIKTDFSVTDLAGVNTHLKAAYGMAACSKDFSRQFATLSLKTWPVANLRSLLDRFASIPPFLRKASFVMLEGFSTHRVTSIPNDSTAFPNREDLVVISPLLGYLPNKTVDCEVQKLAKAMRDDLLRGTGEKLRTYVNHAAGDESLEEVYGHEQWRLEKLRALKKEYDPHGRFNFYAPITYYTN